MISETNYMELMRNCVKWNTRTMEERKKRLRYPYYDHQTATAQRECRFTTRTVDHIYPSADKNTVLQFESERWRKRKDIPPSDALEVKMFLRDNPALDSAVNQTIPQPPTTFEQTSDNSNDSINVKERPSRQQIKEEYREDYVLDDDGSPEENFSDEDDWSTRKRRRTTGGVPKSAPGRKKVSTRNPNYSYSTPTNRGVQPLAPSSQPLIGRPPKNHAHPPPPRAPSSSDSDEKRHACDKCSAKYKSLAGLSYHLSYSHDIASSHPTHKLLSPNIEISDFCDLCLGNAYMNKTSKQPEDLVTCHDCGRSGHPSCLSFNKNVTVIINRYGWQCIECKSCTICGTSENDDKLLFCDDCDRGYHLYCLRPQLEKAPDDEYSCRLCQIEFGDKASAPAKK
ncbi:unnamed protein product [Caenorhabditis angaria]|uniref:PHD-type domain-containing protein n=1 Tax=Caenorhabditis angaria TaxID=860376 RepID=A0A9P1IJC2_9PELO|nr:unnamed protein product [Caenorhabditis angaria]